MTHTALFAALVLAGATSLAAATPAGAMRLGLPAAHDTAQGQTQALEQVRERGERPRRENRRDDRRRADAGQADEGAIVLAREGSERPRREDRRNDRRGDRRQG